MNLTSTPVRGAASSDEVTLMGDTDVTMPAAAQQQSESPETVMENQQDFAAVLGKDNKLKIIIIIVPFACTEHISIECHKTKAITMDSQNKDEYQKEPINKYNQPQVWENTSSQVAIGLSCRSDWLGKWCKFSRSITERIIKQTNVISDCF